jgi:glutamate N-acetyltransferase/amino-acid N-acetyltransferase
VAVGSAEALDLAPVPGVRLGTASAGIKTPGRPDLVVMEIAAGSTCAAVFTQNAFCAAPVRVAREHLAACNSAPRHLLVNTGNANAGTGEPGIADARTCCRELARLAGVEPTAVLPFSTGVIGEALPVGRVIAALPDALAGLSEDGWEQAASGILTTDTRPKGCSVHFSAGGRSCVLTGIAKGAGMLRPDMATMLAYLATDAAVAPELLQRLLAGAVDRSFNRITVDGDTSTNDACVLIATGAAGNAPLDVAEGALYSALESALEQVCTTLACGLVRDGEGASKFVAVEVGGGRSEAECLAVAFTIAHSPLVKTALFASDPNWGRLLAAIGRAGLPALEVERVSLFLNGVLIAEGGCRAAAYTEEQGVAAMAPEEITVRVELDRGDARATVWTSDFSYDYVRINAEYRT